MRWLPLVAMLLALTACGLGEDSPTEPVDVSKLAPLSSREQALMYAADGAVAQGNYVAAERDYLTAVKESQGRIDAHLALAALYVKQEMPDRQREILEKALELQPNHPYANYQLGKLALNDARYSDALKAFATGRKTRPNDVDLAVGEAVAQDMLGQHRAAQDVYREAERRNTGANLTMLRANLGMSYLLSGDAKKAITLLKNDAKKPGAPAVTRHNLALAYGYLGNDKEAKALLKGELDEPERMLAVARLKEYVKDHREAEPPPVTPRALEKQEVELDTRPTKKKAPVTQAPTKPKAAKPAQKSSAAAAVDKPKDLTPTAAP